MAEGTVSLRDERGILKAKVSDRAFALISKKVKGRFERGGVAGPGSPRQARFVVEQSMSWRLTEEHPMLPTLFLWEGDFFQKE